MFPTFIGILDIQSWWEVPSIAHFCSLFRAAFNLLDFDIEDLEEALLTDGGAEGRLVQELIVKLLEGCLPNDTRNDISTFNYQMFLRRLFRKKCQEYNYENPFNTDVDFELLPLRQKVEILRALCDFRLDAEDVEQSLSNLDSDSLRVEPLGHDRKNSAYWYFYGTRLYREDYIDTSNSASYKQKGKPRDKKRKRRRNRVAKEEQEEEEKEEISLIDGENKGRDSIWQVVCFTQQDWSKLVEKFCDSEYDNERKLYRTLSEDFMPEIPKLFDLKEKQQRRKLLERNSERVLRNQESSTQMDAVMVRSKIKTKTNKGTKKGTQISKSIYTREDTSSHLLTPPIQKKGRQTNNSLASAVGQIVIHTRDEVEDLEKKKGTSKHGDSNYASSNYRYGYSFGIEEEERCVGMHKVLESVKDHVDAWPFIEPVDEEYAPRYYSVVRKPMDLSTMEEKLEGGSYKNLNQFKRDFRLIVDNCRQYNGSDNEYTEMAINLKEAFDKAVTRYLESETSSDEDPASPHFLTETPSTQSHPSVDPLSSSHHNIRKRSKKSTKKSKSYKTETRTKSKNNDKTDEEEKRNKSIKLAKKKKGKKRSKKMKEEELNVSKEEQEHQESENVVCDTNIVTSKRKKNLDVNNSLLKAKKVSPKDVELKTSNKKVAKERYQPKKESEIVRSTKEKKENKKRKEDFEEDYEPLIIAKSKSRKIEKKELEEAGILTDNTKKNTSKKIETKESDTVFEEEKKQSSRIKTKKSRKKKTSLKTVTKADEKSDKSHIKEKAKKSKQKNEELKNGEVKSQTDSKDIELKSTLDSNRTHTSKKFSALISNKDLESLDSLKDKISDKRCEEKLKNEKEKQRRTVKSDIHGIYSKKVPSNGSTFHDNDKNNAKRSKSKKGTKEDKITVDVDAIKKRDPELSQNKKAQIKHGKGLGIEENSSIQVVNQTTEKTLHDINKWLDDAPKLSGFSSGSDSPVFHATVDSNRSGSKIENARKRPSSMKIFGPNKPKKIQRTIDRLQPGKSKGNLLLKKPLNLSNTNTNDSTICNSDNDQQNKDLNEEPKLSLGTVLKNVDSIQLICKSLVSSPNTNFSNDDEDEDHSTSSAQVSGVKEGATVKGTSSITEEKETRHNTEETQKPKSATPNLSAWFKAFGAPKSKKKEEDVEDSATKKDDLHEVFCGRQRRMSAGGSSISESTSNFSQESPPTRASRSPQGPSTVTATEAPIRAGFYQDALSTGSSPYNSPYYATPPRYSAQLPPTPSPQNHPLSPAYPSPASYDQPYPQVPVHSQAPHQSPYQKSSPQENHNDTYQQTSPTYSQRSPQNNFSQNTVSSESYPQQLSSNNQNQSPIYPQHSPQPVQSIFPQQSPQAPPSNYSQPSPQQPPTPKYSQPSPQNAVANYSQPSPQAVASYSQASPQQQHSPYSQPSPQAPPNYSQPSPQQHSPYAQSSPQNAGYSQLSPQPPPNYSQPSPQPPNVYSQPAPQTPGFSQSSPQTHSANYSQPSPQTLNTYAQASPQSRNYSQPSPQQIQTFPQHSPQAPSAYSQASPQNNSFSQSSPQSLTNYSQPSPQQPATYSHPLHSPQTPPNYPQLSPQQAPTTNYSQPSPQQSHNYPQSSPQRKSTCPIQPPQQSPNYSQPSPQQTANYSQLQSSKNSEEYPAAAAAASNYSQSFKQTPSYIQQSSTSSINESEHRTEYLKPNASEKSSISDQQRNFAVQSESLNLNTNHQIYQQPNQYPPTYPNSFSNIELQRSTSRHGNQEQTQQPTSQERPSFTEISETLNAPKYAQARSFLSKAPNTGEQLPTQDQQLLAFQPNLAHESLYQSGFQPSNYPLSNSRPMYPNPHYFDPSSKSANSGTSSPAATSSLPPVKKRAYNEPAGDSSLRTVSQETTTRVSQEQFSFDPMMALPQSDAVSASQFDGTFVGSLTDPVTSNPAYARLGLGLMGRPSKEQQQLLTIPRPATKSEHLAYGRSTASGASELDLNLLQTLQSAATKNTQSILTMSRRTAESSVASAAAPPKAKRGRKSKQLQQEQQSTAVGTTVATSTVGSDQQPGISFPQYAAAPVDTIGLKTTGVVPPAGSAFNFAASTSTTTSSPFYDKDATAAAFAFLDEFRNPTSYYNMALRQQQQQQQQQQQVPPVTDASQSACNKLSNQPPRNYPPHPFLHSAQRSAAYGPPVPTYVTPHGPNLAVDPAAYQQYIHSLYALQPPPHHHRPSWL